MGGVKKGRTVESQQVGDLDAGWWHPSFAKKGEDTEKVAK